MQLEKIRAAAERVARPMGLEIHDVEWKVGKQRLLRVILDRPWPVPEQPPETIQASGGITHEDCQGVSEQLSTLLDVEELIPGGSYVLEVSSPGLDRRLVRPLEYRRFSGRLAQITLTEPIEGATFYEARLAGCEETAKGPVVRIEVEVRGARGKKDSRTPPRIIYVPFERIKKAQLVVEL